MVLLLGLLMLCGCSAAAFPRSHTVTSGVLEDGTVVGTYTSQIQNLVVDNEALYPAVTKEQLSRPWQNASTTLRYLYLKGDKYLADVPLQLPSCFVLVLDTTIALAQNISFGASTRFSAVVELSSTKFSAVIGGTIDAANLPTPDGTDGYMAVSITKGKHNAVRNVRANSNGTNSIIAVNGGSENEVSDCDLGGSSVCLCPSRALWALATERVFALRNHIHHCYSHALDFDAYTKNSVAVSNLCEDNAKEGIFVEETASSNLVFNNTCRRNTDGIGIYSNAVGPVANNFIIGNIVADNIRDGIIAGGFGHNPDKHSGDNVFLANSGGPYQAVHGANIGDYWTGNVGAMVGTVPMYGANVTVFNP